MSSIQRRILSVLLASVCTATVVLAMGGKYPDHGLISTPKQGWSAALPAAINSPGRVAGHWVNSNDEFFYRGDSKAFGEFIRRLADTKLPLTLVLHANPQHVHRSLLWGDEPNIPYDWSLLVVQAGWVSPEWKLNFDDPQTKFAVRVDAWLDGLTLDALDLPAGVRLIVDSGSSATTQPATREAAR